MSGAKSDSHCIARLAAVELWSAAASFAHPAIQRLPLWSHGCREHGAPSYCSTCQRGPDSLESLCDARAGGARGSGGHDAGRHTYSSARPGHAQPHASSCHHPGDARCGWCRGERAALACAADRAAGAQPATALRGHSADCADVVRPSHRADSRDRHTTRHVSRAGAVCFSSNRSRRARGPLSHQWRLWADGNIGGNPAAYECGWLS